MLEVDLVDNDANSHHEELDQQEVDGLHDLQEEGKARPKSALGKANVSPMQLDFIHECQELVNTATPGSHVKQWFAPPDPSRELFSDPTAYFLRLVFVWEPLKQFSPDIVRGLPCPHCGALNGFQDVRCHVRAVLDFDNYFYLAHKQLSCVRCKRSFMNSDEKVIAKLPLTVRMSFSIIFGQRIALSCGLSDHISKLSEKMGPFSTASLLNSMYVAHFEVKKIKYLAQNTRSAYLERTANANSDELFDFAQSEALVENGGVLLSETQKKRFAEAEEAIVLPVANVNGVGISKAEKLKTIHTHQDFHRTRYLGKFSKGGINFAFELAGIPIEELTSREEQGLIEACILTGKLTDENRNEPRRSRVYNQAKSWVTSARQTLNLRYHTNMEEVERSLEEKAQLEQRNELARGKLKETMEVNMHAPVHLPPFGEYKDVDKFNGYTFSTATISDIVKYIIGKRGGNMLKSTSPTEQTNLEHEMLNGGLSFEFPFRPSLNDSRQKVLNLLENDNDKVDHVIYPISGRTMSDVNFRVLCRNCFAPRQDHLEQENFGVTCTRPKKEPTSLDLCNLPKEYFKKSSNRTSLAHQRIPNSSTFTHSTPSVTKRKFLADGTAELHALLDQIWPLLQACRKIPVVFSQMTLHDDERKMIGLVGSLLELICSSGSMGATKDRDGDLALDTCDHLLPENRLYASDLCQAIGISHSSFGSSGGPSNKVVRIFLSALPLLKDNLSWTSFSESSRVFLTFPVSREGLTTASLEFVPLNRLEDALPFDSTNYHPCNASSILIPVFSESGFWVLVVAKPKLAKLQLFDPLAAPCSALRDSERSLLEKVQRLVLALQPPLLPQPTSFVAKRIAEDIAQWRLSRGACQQQQGNLCDSWAAAVGNALSLLEHRPLHQHYAQDDLKAVRCRICIEVIKAVWSGIGGKEEIERKVFTPQLRKHSKRART